MLKNPESQAAEEAPVLVVKELELVRSGVDLNIDYRESGMRR